MYIIDHGSLYTGYFYCGQAPMSAITIVYTHEGFLLAADSLQVGSDGSRIALAQKIFPVGDPGLATIGYGIAGTVRIMSDETNATQFDFWAEAHRIAGNLLPLSRALGLRGYANAFATELQSSLGDSMRRDATLLLPSGQYALPLDGEREGITCLLFCGYPSSEVPEFGCVTLAHKSQVLAEPIVQMLSPAIGLVQGFLSQSIAEGLFNPASQSYKHKGFLRYRVPSDKPVAARSLDDALKLAMSYFAACKDLQVRTLDEAHCNSVGGEIVAATLTPQSGFRWIPTEKVRAAAEGFAQKD